MKLHKWIYCIKIMCRVQESQLVLFPFVFFFFFFFFFFLLFFLLFFFCFFVLFFFNYLFLIKLSRPTMTQETYETQSGNIIDIPYSDDADDVS